MNRKIKLIAGVQIAAFGLLAASALGVTSSLASASHSGHYQGTVDATSTSSTLKFGGKPFKSN